MRRVLGSTAVAVAVTLVGAVPVARAADVVLPGVSGQARLLALDAQGRMAIVSTADGSQGNLPTRTLRVDRSTGAITDLPVLRVASPDGSTAITQDFRWLEVATGRTVPVPVRPDVTRFALAADGRTYAAGGPIGTVGWVIDGPTQQRSGIPVAGFPQSMSSDARFLLIGTSCTDPAGELSCDFSRWDRASGTVERVVSRAASETLLAAIGDDGTVVLARSGAREEPVPTAVVVRRPGAPDRIHTSTSDSGLYPFLVRPLRQGRLLVYASAGLAVFDTATGWLSPLTSCSSACWTYGGVAVPKYLSDGMLSADGTSVVGVEPRYDGTAVALVLTDLVVGGAPLNPVAPLGLAVVSFYRPPFVGTRAVLLNVTVTNPVADGFARVWPCGSPAPLASNLNFAAGQTVAVTVLATIDATDVCFGSNTRADLVVDRQGWFDLGTSYQTLVPARIADTRAGQEDLVGNVGPLVPVEVPIAGVAGVGADASAAMLSVTLVNPSSTGFATVWPCGEPMPTASNLNVAAGQTVAAAVLAKVGVGGKVCVASNVRADVIVDAQGWFGPGPEYRPLTPVRLDDTRAGATGVGQVAASSAHEVPVAGRHGVPTDTTSAVLNLTVTNPTAAGFAVVWPCGEPKPGSSNVNFGAGQTVANLVISRLGANGSVCISANGQVDVVVDVEGTFGADSHLVGGPTSRLLDTRSSGHLR
jgi:hypothetical protein